MNANSFSLAALSWRWSEQPARLSRFPRRWVFALAAAGMAIFASIGFAGYFTGGFPQRFPQGDNTRNYYAMYREYVCLSESRLYADWREESCTFPAHAPPSAPRLFVWGDSYAAQYVEGLRRLGKAIPLTVIQGTAGGYPPLLQGTASHDPTCEQFNQSMIRHIVADKPDLVLMAAIWREAQNLANLDTSVRTTVETLRKAGIAVMLIGDAPTYYSDIPQVQQMMRLHGVDDQWQVPVTMVWADPTLRTIVADYGLSFFSPVEFWCRGVKCRFTDGQLFTFDRGHLTAHGSEVIVRAMRPKIENALQGKIRHPGN
jgi:hypothetical protein